MEDKTGTWKIAADCLRRIATSLQLDRAAKDTKLQKESEKGSFQVYGLLGLRWVGNGVGQFSNMVIGHS